MKKLEQVTAPFCCLTVWLCHQAGLHLLEEVYSLRHLQRLGLRKESTLSDVEQPVVIAAFWLVSQLQYHRALVYKLSNVSVSQNGLDGNYISTVATKWKQECKNKWTKNTAPDAPKIPSLLTLSLSISINSLLSDHYC